MNKFKNYYVQTPEGKVLHAVLDTKAGKCCVFPFDGEGWFPNFYIHCDNDFITSLQNNNCQTLRFKDKGLVAEVNLIRCGLQGHLASHNRIPIISIPKKWAKRAQGENKKQPVLFQ